MVGLYAQEIVALEEVKKHEIVGPWLTERNLVLLYGPYGSGKSTISLGLAHAAATGAPIFRDAWQPHRPYRVCYCDSEMGRQAWKTKLSQIDSASRVSLSGECLKFICSEDMGGGCWNLSDPEAQKILYQEFLSFDLIIIDNLIDFSMRLTRFDDDIMIWRRIEVFLKQLRDEGKTVIVVHHSGKSGDQIGTSEHRKAMDTVVKLTPNMDPEFQGLKVDMHFEKSRWFFGSAIQPLRIEYGKETDSEKQFWRTITLKEAQGEWANRKKKMGWTHNDLCKTLMINESQLKEVLGDMTDPFFGPRYGSSGSDEIDRLLV